VPSGKSEAKTNPTDPKKGIITFLKGMPHFIILSEKDSPRVHQKRIERWKSRRKSFQLALDLDKLYPLLAVQEEKILA